MRSLRYVALTAPYFHNGDVGPLREAVAFYGRDGNVASVRALGGPVLTADEIDAIVPFLETLTDERVVDQRAPFDHPELFVPNGHPGNATWTVDRDHDGFAGDHLVAIPVGAVGGALLPGFLEGPFGPAP